MKTSIFCSILFCSTVIKAQSVLQIGTTSVQVDTIVSGLDVPWEIVYAQDGYLWVTEREGLVSRVHIATKTKEVVLDIRNTVTQQAESGLLGMALHPNFETTPDVFLAYTYSALGTIQERIVKYTFNNTELVNPEILLDNIEGNGTHNGCRLFILPDNTLLATTGDVQNLSTPQDTNALNGKILRINLNGSIPSDNPYAGKYTYSFGHRNTQGLAMLPNNTILMAEHGASSDDEVQLLFAGRNYGWPNVEGFCDNAFETNFCNNNNVVEPLTVYTPTIAPSDLVYYTNNNFPEWDSCALMTVLKDKELRALKLNSTYTQITSDEAYLQNLFGRLRDIAVGPNKEIYLATNGQSWSNIDPGTHSIIRLTPPAPIPTSVKIENKPSSVLHVYPNPANTHVYLEYSNLDENSVYTLIVENTLGQELIKQKVYSKKHELNLNTLPSKGLYYIRIIDSNNQSVEVQKLFRN
jgi:glucose/arabinose dehydrogenase